MFCFSQKTRLQEFMNNENIPIPTEETRSKKQVSSQKDGPNEEHEIISEKSGSNRNEGSNLLEQD